MSKRINVLIDEDTWGFLGRVPAGGRSRAINEALRVSVIRRRRNDDVREMAALRAQLSKNHDTDQVDPRRSGACPLNVCAAGSVRCFGPVEMGAAV